MGCQVAAWMRAESSAMRSASCSISAHGPLRDTNRAPRIPDSAGRLSALPANGWTAGWMLR